MSEPPLRIAYLVYRGNPHCGGQGVYTRALANELTQLGHEITVLSGPPYPDLVEPEQLWKVPGLDLYRATNPFRVPWPHEIRDRIDLGEVAIMSVAGYPEPWGFSMRARKLLRDRRADFDLVHDNQCLGTGLLDMMRDRRLAGRRDAAPPDHRRPRPRPGARDQPVAALLAAALVLVPRHADAGRARDPPGAHGVRVLTRRHRRPDGRPRRAPARRARRHRPRRLPPDARDRPGPRAAHDDRERRRAAEGARPPPRGRGQGPHGARRRAPRRDRPAEAQEQDPRAHRAAGHRRPRRVREGRDDRADRRALRRGRGRVRAVAVRGLLAARGRGDGVRRARRRHDRRRGPRGARSRQRDRPDRPRGRRGRAGADDPARARRPAAARAHRRGRPRACADELHVAQTAEGTAAHYRALLDEHDHASRTGA